MMKNVKQYLMRVREELIADGVVSTTGLQNIAIPAIGSRITLHSANVVSQRGDLSWYQAGYRYPTMEKEGRDV